MSLTPAEARKVLEQRRGSVKSESSSIKKESGQNKFKEGLGLAFGQHKGYEEQAARSGQDLVTNLFNAIKSKSSGKEFVPQKTGEGGFYDFSNMVLGGTLMRPFDALGLVTRVAGEIGLSGLMNPDTEQGLKEGATTAAIVESIPFLGKLTRGFADKFTRKDFTKGTMDAMRSDFLAKQEKGLSYLNPLLDKYGKNTLTGVQKESLEEVFRANEKYLGPDVIEKYEDFIKDPTMKNAQKFQSIVGADIRKLDDTQVVNRDRIQASNKFREEVLDQMYNRFDQIAPKGTENHKMFRDIWAKEVKPYESSPTLSRVVHGETKGITPKTLDNALGKASQGDFSQIPQGHPVQSFSKSMDESLKLSELYGETGKIGTGVAGAAGGYSMFGPYGLAGYLAGPFAAQMGSSVGKVVQNDILQRELSRLYPTVRTGIYGESIQPEEQ